LPLHPSARRQRIVLSGEVPNPMNPPAGCRFHPRCPVAMPICSEVEPVLTSRDGGGVVACHLY
jgi:oligopeptide/dipeptide ABC transporter ATP-binding protein